MTRRPTPMEKSGIMRDYKRMKVDDVLLKWGIARNTLYRIVRGRKRGVMSRKVTSHVKDQIATMNYRGYSDTRIAGLLGLSQDTVSRHRKEMKLPDISTVRMD